jgi:hypothetical protein
MRKKSMKEAEAAIEETVKKWDPAKDPHIEVHSCCASPCIVCCTHHMRDEPVKRYAMS